MAVITAHIAILQRDCLVSNFRYSKTDLQVLIFSSVFQNLVNFCYRFPKSEFNKFRRFGGYLAYRRMLNGKLQMKKAAFTLPPVLSFVDGLPIYFLTGEKYLYQTLFCIRSLSIVSREKFRFILIDDGSFNQSILNKLIKLLPGALIVRSETIEQNIKERFAEIQFPVLNEKRRIYPHIKKLTDIHTLPGSEWKLVLDSDMLFWKEPVALIEWLKSPELPIHMIDCTNSYGYSLNLMEELSSCKIRPLINVGAIGINSNKIDWKAVEEWITGLEKKEGATYYLEQAISAMLIGDQNAFHLNNSEYIVNPDNEEVVHKRGTLHHYVDVSKKPYFNQLWKEFIDG